MLVVTFERFIGRKEDTLMARIGVHDDVPPALWGVFMIVSEGGKPAGLLLESKRELPTTVGLFEAADHEAWGGGSTPQQRQDHLVRMATDLRREQSAWKPDGV